MEKKTKRIFFVLHIISFEWGTANIHNREQDTCNRQSMCGYKHSDDFKLQ